MKILLFVYYYNVYDSYDSLQFFYWFLDIENDFYKYIKSILYFIKSIVFKIFLNKLQIIVGGLILIFSNYYMRYFLMFP